MLDKRYHIQCDTNGEQAALNHDESPRSDRSGDPVSKRRPRRHYRLRYVASRSFRPKVEQPLKILGGQTHLVILLGDHPAQRCKARITSSREMMPASRWPSSITGMLRMR